MFSDFQRWTVKEECSKFDWLLDDRIILYLRLYVKTLRVIRMSLINESCYWNQREVWFSMKFYAKMWTWWVKTEYFSFFYSFDEILFWEDESGGYSFNWKYIDVFGLVEIVFEMCGKNGNFENWFQNFNRRKFGRCVRKKYFRYNRNFFEAREFSSIISNEDYAYILWCTYQISKFSLFNLESFQSEDLEISKISQWMKLNIFRNSCLKKIWKR